MESSLASAVNSFAFDLLKVLNQGNDENIFFSPLSIFTCLNMAALGSKGNTSEELFKGLRCDKAASSYQELHSQVKKMLEGYSKDGLPYALYLANKLLVQKGEPLVAEYRDTVVTHYKASIDDVDFEKEAPAVVTAVNGWVNKQTRGMINSIISDIPRSTRAILLNAIYFKGKWCKPFDTKDTKPDLFYRQGKKDGAVEVPFMYKHQLRCTLSCYKIGTEKVKVLELPYEGAISMCVIVPEALDGLSRIVAAVQFPHDPEAGTYEIYHKANVWLPKFKFETMYTMNDSLQELKMVDCFGSDADFSGIRGTRDVNISQVIHKAVIDVNEEGTEAAAVTGIMFGCCMAAIPPPVVECKVDRPFLFYLKDTRMDLILFMGTVKSL